MNVLVIGSGGREHAIAWSLARSKQVGKVYVAPGNGGTATEDGVWNVPLEGIDAWIQFAKENQVRYTIVGPEAPLAQGVVDRFKKAGLAIFGPTKNAAQLESSKTFAKEFMWRHQIPTAQATTHTDPTEALAECSKRSYPLVIKADGLCAGKGVFITQTVEEARIVISQLLSQTGDRILLEDFIQGEEASFIVMVDGKNILPLATSQDHKRLLNNDLGPNTGGMGAYSPAPIITPDLHAQIMRDIIIPTVKGMEAEGHPYTGFLYAGLMITPQGAIKTLEFNCRLGDPETEPILMRLKTDLITLLEKAHQMTLDQVSLDWDWRPAVGVVVASTDYPHSGSQGQNLKEIPPNTSDLHIFHGGTILKDKQTLTNGGRLLCVTALGCNLKEARQLVYDAIGSIQVDGGFQYRTDIGHRALR